MDYAAMLSAGLLPPGDAVISISVGHGTSARTLAVADLASDGTIIMHGDGSSMSFTKPQAFVAEVFRRDHAAAVPDGEAAAPRPANSRPFTSPAAHPPSAQKNSGTITTSSCLSSFLNGPLGEPTCTRIDGRTTVDIGSND